MKILRFARYLQDLSRSAIDLPRDEERNELLRHFPKIDVAAHQEIFMAAVGIAERVRIVLENVDFPGQTFFPQPFFSRRQTGFKKPLTGFIMDDEIKNVVALGGGILRMAAGVLIKPSAVHQKGVGGPAVRNETFKNIPQHLLHRQIYPPVRRKDETVLILQTEDPSSQGTGLQHACTNRIPAGPAFFNRRTQIRVMETGLGREELFGIGGRKTTESSAVAGAVQNRHFQALQRELLVPDLFECGDTEREGISQFRRLRQTLFL